VTDRIVKIRFIGDGITTLSGQVTALGKSVGSAADKMTGASKEAGKFRRGLDQVGGTAGKVGLVAAAGLGAIVVATANFEQAMSRVEAATHASASTMEDLRKAAIVAGRDTVFSATEAADAITAMSKAGVSAKDILGGGLTGALSLASAGELDVASAADIAATAMNQFGLSGRDIPHIADVLAAAAGKAQGEVTDMANSLKYVGPVAHQLGISIEETAGTIAELASQGVLGEQAGTSLRGMLTALTSPSKVAAQTMKNLGAVRRDRELRRPPWHRRPARRHDGQADERRTRPGARQDLRQ
jgi:phage-related minor tail protein